MGSCASSPAPGPSEASPLTGSPPTGLMGGREAPACWKRLRANREAMTIVACSMFMMASSTMLIANKVVVKHFDTPVLVLIFQAIFAVAACGTLLRGSLHFGSRKDVVRFLKVVPLFYSTMLGTSMVAQRYASLGMQVVIRNVAPLIALPVERCMNEPIVADWWTWLSMLTILVGVSLYVVESLGLAPYQHADVTTPEAGAAHSALTSADYQVQLLRPHVDMAEQPLGDVLIGAALVVVNMALAIIERMFQRKLLAIDPVDISKTGMLMINNAIAVPLLSTIIYPLGECHWDSIRHWAAAGTVEGDAGSSWYHYLLLVLSAVCGVVIGWTSLNAQQYVTATTMLLITNLNKVLVIIFGMVAPFGVISKEPSGAFAIVGCTMALSGGVWYALVRRNLGLQQEKARKSQLGPRP